MRRTVPPSAEIEEQIDRLLAVGVGENPRESLSELAKLGARLIIQRAVEDEFDAWLGRARYERRPAYQRGLRNHDAGLRNGFRSRRVQTLEGELRQRLARVLAHPHAKQPVDLLLDLRRRRYGTSHGVGLLHRLAGLEGTYAVALTALSDLQQLGDAT